MNVCRICLVDEREEDLVSACRCRGSVQFTHQHCLSAWLQAKYRHEPGRLVQPRDGPTGLTCELCTYEYQGQVRLNSFSQVCKQLFSSENTLAIVLNLFVTVYMVYTIRGLNKAAALQWAKVWVKWAKGKGNAKVLLTFLRFLNVKLLTGLHCLSLPVLLCSTYKLVGGLLAQCCSLRIAPYVRDY